MELIECERDDMKPPMSSGCMRASGSRLILPESGAKLASKIDLFSRYALFRPRDLSLGPTFEYACATCAQFAIAHRFFDTDEQGVHVVSRRSFGIVIGVPHVDPAIAVFAEGHDLAKVARFMILQP